MVDAVQVGTVIGGAGMATDRVIQASESVEQLQSGIEQHTISTPGGRRTATNNASIKPDMRDTRQDAIPDAPMAPTQRMRMPGAHTVSRGVDSSRGKRPRAPRCVSGGYAKLQPLGIGRHTSSTRASVWQGERLEGATLTSGTLTQSLSGPPLNHPDRRAGRYRPLQ